MSAKPDAVFVGNQRRVCATGQAGIQYIPGHVESFIDLVLERHLPATESILDLGGGGLRFAIPVALKGKCVTVLDSDAGSLDVDDIARRAFPNDNDPAGQGELNKLIETRVGDLKYYLTHARRKYELITAFRVMHFFAPEDIDRLFKAVRRRLGSRGVFAVSAMTPFDFKTGGHNEIQTHSKPVDYRNVLFREFLCTPKAAEIRSLQNLPARIHLVTADYMARQARKHDFEVVLSAFEATRIVQGFVLRRRPVSGKRAALDR